MKGNKYANMKLSKIILEEDQPTIEELQKEIQKLEDRNKQYVSIHTDKLQKMKSDIKAYLYTSLQREINTLEDTAEILDDRNKNSITMSIFNIKQILRDLIQ